MKTLNEKPHIEDEIYRIKNFINELSHVQTTYFEKLIKDYNFNEKGNDWLFDYIFNSADDEEMMDFEEYVVFHNMKMEELFNKVKKYAFRHKPTKTWVYVRGGSTICLAGTSRDATLFESRRGAEEVLKNCSFNQVEGYGKDNFLEFQLKEVEDWG
jgi:hypothetical protein